MAVIEVVDVRYRKFSGYDDPRYPSGMWVGEGEGTGDGTGGDNSIQIDFSKSTGQFNSQYYSLEQMMFRQAGTGDVDVGLLLVNFDLVSGGPTGGFYTLPILGNEQGAGALSINAGGTLPLFLGQQFNPNSAMSITLSLNNDTGIVITAKLQGYVWSARSTNVSGGPQRPPTGLYRS